MGPIAQLVELPAHNRMVGGSSPSGPTTFFLFTSLPQSLSCLSRNKYEIHPDYCIASGFN